MKLLRLVVPVALGALTGCTSIGLEGPYGSVSVHQPRPGYSDPPQPQHRNGSYFHEHGYTRLDIPKGHYPPPGECRLWYPDRPPGQQLPPFRCDGAVPPGAWLIEHPRDVPNQVHVKVYERSRPGVIRAIGEFEIGSGVLVRVVLDR